MSKIHITLVGGQALPVYNAIKATQPEYIVYVHSRQSVKLLPLLTAEIDTPYESIILDATNPFEINEMANGLAEKYAEDDVWVNISSGPKSWAYFFSVAFSSRANATVMYMDQNNVIWDYNQMQSIETFEFDMDPVFRLHNNKLEHYTPYTDYTSDDLTAQKKVGELRRFCYEDFNELTANLDKKKQNILANQKTGVFESKKSNSFVEWDKSGEVPFVRLSLCNKRGEVLEKTIESPHIIDIVFNSGWFEYRIASIISQWNKFKEIRMNCKFKLKPNVDKNEVDIIVNAGIKIFFVEVKTQIFDTTAIDKFASVVKGYGGTASKALFVTDAPMSELALKKCEERYVIPFSLKNYATPKAAKDALYKLLDENLYNFNI